MTRTPKVLVVDDEPVVLASAARILEAEGLPVLTAPDTEVALGMLGVEGPDILITDLVLPGASGMKLLEAAAEQEPGLIIIVTTGYSTVENAVAALKHGAFDFLPKPFTCDELLSCVARACRAVELRLNLATPDTSRARRGGGRLGRQTWARPERDGTARLGITDLQLRTIGPIDRIELPQIASEVRQGGRLVGIHSSDGLTHALWSPLGGRVLTVNDRLEARPESVRDDPEGTGWMVQVLPADLEEELSNLIEF